MSRFLAALIMAAFSGALCACAGPTGVTIPPGSDQLKQCEPKALDVETLSSLGEPGCDLVGSTVRLPDGTALQIDEVGVVASHESPRDAGTTETLVVNWGVPGVAVSEIDENRLITQWASSTDAAELQRQQLLLEGVRGL